jgi:ATP-binding cassette, subfamily B (MDR/TAP), member 1
MQLISRIEVPVLRGLNLEVKPGQYVALVGPSGCGKTTCVSLLERFYDPLIGRITVDGVLVSEYNLSDYRKCVSLVSQEPTYKTSSSIVNFDSLYQGTVRFNILLGANELDPTQEEIDQACKSANVRTLLTF